MNDFFFHLLWFAYGLRVMISVYVVDSVWIVYLRRGFTQNGYLEEVGINVG